MNREEPRPAAREPHQALEFMQQQARAAEMMAQAASDTARADFLDNLSAQAPPAGPLEVNVLLVDNVGEELSDRTARLAAVQVPRREVADRTTDDIRRSLKEHQLRAFEPIAEWIDARVGWIMGNLHHEPEPGRFLLQAAGGSGKTFLVERILEYFKAVGPQSCEEGAALCCAFTAAAAILVKGTTVHSLFGLNNKEKSMDGVVQRLRQQLYGPDGYPVEQVSHRERAARLRVPEESEEEEVEEQGEEEEAQEGTKGNTARTKRTGKATSGRQNNRR